MVKSKPKLKALGRSAHLYFLSVYARLMQPWVEFCFSLRESKLILKFQLLHISMEKLILILDATRIIARIDSRILAEFLALLMKCFVLGVRYSTSTNKSVLHS